MGNDGFLRRWARLKSSGAAQPLPLPPSAGKDASRAGEAGGDRIDREAVGAVVASSNPAVAGAATPPTLEDAGRLTAASDYSAFVAQGVDKAVRRLALKKLFSDPHFNLMDGLDIYISDYNRADPVPASMLAALRQAQGFLEQADDASAPDSPDELTAGEPAADEQDAGETDEQEIRQATGSSEDRPASGDGA